MMSPYGGPWRGGPHDAEPWTTRNELVPLVSLVRRADHGGRGDDSLRAHHRFQPLLVRLCGRRL